MHGCVGACADRGMASGVTTHAALLVRNVEIDGRAGLDCLIRDRVVAAVDAGLSGDVAEVIDGNGGALLPGLADHHLHLLAMAAAAHSVDVSAEADLSALACHADGSGWLRVIGWDERQGEVDRRALDRLVPNRPVRVQHRSGALWVLNSAAIQAARATGGDPPAGAERDETGELTGRLWREDRWLQSAPNVLPSLAHVGAELASYGITAVTDATPDLDERALGHLARAVDDGSLPQRVQLMCAEVPPRPSEQVSLGPRKLVIHDHELPGLESLIADIASAHESRRPVAVHCISRVALALTLAALRETGTMPGDRIEHCAIADESAVAVLAELGVTVVTQPSLITRRGDDYLDAHEPAECGDLWRFGSLLRAGIPTVASSDAPYGTADPWLTMRSARDRCTASGRVLGGVDRVAVQTTLDGLLADASDPGWGPRRLEVGTPGDVVLLRAPITEALANPTSELVATTIVNGRIVFDRGD